MANKENTLDCGEMTEVTFERLSHGAAIYKLWIEVCKVQPKVGDAPTKDLVILETKKGEDND